MNRQINSIIPIALSTISDKNSNLISYDKNNKVGINKKANGYVTSLGTAILQSGLFASIAFFDKKQDDNLKPNLSKAIAKVMCERYSYYSCDSNDRIIELLIKEYEKEDTNLKRFQNDLTNVLIAFKLALRTFYLYEE